MFSRYLLQAQFQTPMCFGEVCEMIRFQIISRGLVVGLEALTVKTDWLELEQQQLDGQCWSYETPVLQSHYTSHYKPKKV